MNFKYISLTILLFGSLFSFAQKELVEKSPLELRAGAGFGVASLNISSDLNMSSQGGSFFLGGVTADYYFAKNLGVGVGLEYNRSSIDVGLSDYNHTYSDIDDWEGDARNYDFSINSNNTDIIENNTFGYIDLPISVVYRMPLSSKLYLSARGGVKIGFPLSANYMLSSSNLTTRLYLEDFDLEIFNVPAHGCYENRTDWHPEGEMETSLSTSVFAELGVDYDIANKVNARVAAYFAYGLNNILEQQESSLIYWRNDYNHLLTLNQSTSITQIGIKLSFSLIPQPKEIIVPKGQNLPMM